MVKLPVACQIRTIKQQSHELSLPHGFARRRKAVDAVTLTTACRSNKTT
jgi:hypothetical protein